jgi:hypothetical protein
MKIIQIDSFGGESTSDVIIAENVPKYYVKFLVDRLNEKYSSDSSSVFFRYVKDNYILYMFKP